MLEKLFNNNPLGVVMLCVSIIGTGFVMNYRLDSIDDTQHSMADDIKTIQQDVGTLQQDVAGLKAVNDYKDKVRGNA